MSSASPPNADRPGSGPPKEYALTSDLAQFCLPKTYADESRRIAWIDSICLLFLLIGLIGIKARPIELKKVEDPTELIPIVELPTEEPPPVEILKPDETVEEQPDTVVETPRVVTVVAANTAAVAFAIPVEGPVVVAPARFASAPPHPAAQQQARPKAVIFNPGKGDGGRYPDPIYPLWMQQKGMEGRITVLITVDAAGFGKSVDIRDGSGHPSLDKHVQDWVRTKWQWPAAGPRLYIWTVTFQIPK